MFNPSGVYDPPYSIILQDWMPYRQEGIKFLIADC